MFQSQLIRAESIEAFGLALDEADQSIQFELWLNASAGPAICMLRNAEHAWLMYLPNEGESGFTSIGDPQRKDSVAYCLSNGQIDEYPGSWCIPLETCYAALIFFFASEGERPDWIHWRTS